ncbi:hypothetical protein Dda_7490 [Drechslerella dactyloides]|uniref:Uncharacterized protein n=1 Tax=Drechslerella dactyloides TaxID=74499 RepID=A0AAD6ISN5_DREDA|nr:hypothetical protein Dda_7490 [Drechslerella dactyloides]
MQTHSRLLAFTCLLSSLRLGSALPSGNTLPSSLFARQMMVPEGGSAEIGFQGDECQLGLWQHYKRVGAAWEGYPFRGVNGDTCVDVANLEPMLVNEISNIEVRGKCECDFFTTNACNDADKAFTAYERQVQDIWMIPDLANYDNKINSWKCRPYMKEMRMCDVEVFAGPHYGGYPYDPSNGQRFQFTSIQDEIGPCMTLGDNTRGKVSSYVIDGCKCDFFSNETCDAGGLVLTDGAPKERHDNSNLGEGQNDKIMSFRCNY